MYDRMVLPPRAAHPPRFPELSSFAPVMCYVVIIVGRVMRCCVWLTVPVEGRFDMTKSGHHPVLELAFVIDAAVDTTRARACAAADMASGAAVVQISVEYSTVDHRMNVLKKKSK